MKQANILKRFGLTPPQITLVTNLIEESQSDIFRDFIGEYLISNHNFTYSVKALMTGKLGLRSEYYTDEKTKVDELNDFLNNPFEVCEGVLQCKRCKSFKTISYSKQVRKSDEATSVFASCIECNNTWKES